MQVKCKSKMRLSPLPVFCLILLQATKGHSDAVEPDPPCHKPRQNDVECEEYAHQVVIPMMGYFKQVNQEIDKKKEEIEHKNNQIKQLEEKALKFQQDITQLRIEVASCVSKDTIIKLLEEKDKSNVEIITFLKQQIEMLTKSIDKKIDILTENQTKDNQNEKNKISSVAQSEDSRNGEIVQLETEGEKPVPTSKEIKSLKQEINLLLKTIEDRNKNITEIKANFPADTGKCTQYDEFIKRQRDIINVKSCIGQDASGLHNITLSNNYTFEVLCNSDIAGPGWTVIQQRINGSVEFQRDWVAYRDGFGVFWDGDFFLGLEKIHRLTTEQPHELFIHMEQFDGSIFFARYNEFAIANEYDQYKMNKLEGFSGSTGDYLSYHKNMKFTTYDRDNDNLPSYNCASNPHYGGWWYNYCATSYLNGRYNGENEKFINWNGLTSLKKVRMMIRPRLSENNTEMVFKYHMFTYNVCKQMLSFS